MRVLVKRGLGNNQAPEIIINPLSCTQSVGVEVGKVYLYDEGFDKWIYDLEIPYRGPVYPSNLITVKDGLLGDIFVCRVTSHRITTNFSEENGIELMSSITMERSIVP